MMGKQMYLIYFSNLQLIDVIVYIHPMSVYLGVFIYDRL